MNAIASDNETCLFSRFYLGPFTACVFLISKQNLHSKSYLTIQLYLNICKGKWQQTVTSLIEFKLVHNLYIMLLYFVDDWLKTVLYLISDVHDAECRFKWSNVSKVWPQVIYAIVLINYYNLVILLT